MHDQSDNIANSIEAYEDALRAKGLPDIPFHASPLMNGKDLYSGIDLRTRKMMFGSFRVFFRHMPVKYHTFAYKCQFPSLPPIHQLQIAHNRPGNLQCVLIVRRLHDL